MKGQSLLKHVLVSLTLILLVFQSIGLVTVSAETTGDRIDLRLLGTADIHMHLADYDYYADEQTDDYGLVRTAQLIYEARQQNPNNLLFDNGDILQGNPLGDYVAKVDPLTEDETHPVYKVLNALEYDAGNLGNHEFDYGLDFLQQSISKADFPIVNANVYEDLGNGEAGENLFDPYVILDREVTDRNGDRHTVKVGVIGFVPPQITMWNRENLLGKVVTKDIVETMEKFLPEMEEQADVIVAIAHSGFGPVERQKMMENATYALTEVDGIDAIIFGHDHDVFPSEDHADIKGVDVEKGTINGIPAVMPGKWGERLGIIDLELAVTDTGYEVVNGTSMTRGIVEDGEAVVERQQALFDLIKDEHEATIDYVRRPVGNTTADINSYFSQIMDDPSIQIVTDAQKWFVEKYVEGTEFDNIPILSAGAPFKAGSRGDPNFYTDVPEGTIAIRNVADLYLYDNTLYTVHIDGGQVREWLEKTAAQFNHIDPTSTDVQELIDMNYRSFNFDVIDGVEYEIDVTVPARYDADGNLINEDSYRIKNLTYNGEPIDEADDFLVVTNNYRATGGGNFPDIDADVVAFETTVENRQVLIDYIVEKGTVDPSADMNWHFTPIEEAVNVVFESSPKAKHYADQLSQVKYVDTLESGFATYSLDMSTPITEAPTSEDQASVEGFKDVDTSDYGHAAIMTLHHAGLLSGVAPNEFMPNNALTRAEVAVLLQRMLGIEGQTASFEDVSEAAWYSEAIGALTEADIIQGYPDATFKPHQAASRAEVATLVTRAFNLTGTAETPFNDIEGTYHEANIEALYYNGLTGGLTASSFGPNQDMTRRDFAIMLYRSIVNN